MDRFRGELHRPSVKVVAVAVPARRGQARTEVRDLHRTLPVIPSCTVPVVAAAEALYTTMVLAERELALVHLQLWWTRPRI